MGFPRSAQGPTGAAGTTRQNVGSWLSTSIAAGDNATPASSTAVVAAYAGASPSMGHVVRRAGTITGLGFNLDANPAGSSIIAYATINGTVQAASAQTLAAGSTRKAWGTFVGIAVSAGDVVGVAIRTGSGWSATTANLIADLEVTL